MAKNTQYTKANGYRVSQKTPWGHPVVYLLSVILVAICTVPVLYIIIGGFRTNSQITNNPSGLPDPWVIQNYVNVAQSDTFWVELKNSLIVAIFTMLGVVVLGIMVSYVIARYKFKYAPLMYSLFSAGLMFPMTVGITPLYLMIRNLGLSNSLAGIILPQIAFGLPQTIIILVPFLQSIPNELEERRHPAVRGQLERLHAAVVRPEQLRQLHLAARRVDVQLGAFSRHGRRAGVHIAGHVAGPDLLHDLPEEDRRRSDRRRQGLIGAVKS